MMPYKCMNKMTSFKRKKDVDEKEDDEINKTEAGIRVHKMHMRRSVQAAHKSDR